MVLVFSRFDFSPLKYEPGPGIVGIEREFYIEKRSSLVLNDTTCVYEFFLATAFEAKFYRLVPSMLII